MDTLIKLKDEIIIDWNNQEFVDYSFSGKPFWLLTNDNRIIICTHFSIMDGFAFPDLIEVLLNKYCNDIIEIICCYPTSAKQDKMFGKYVKIESNFPILITYDNRGEIAIATISEKI